MISLVSTAACLTCLAGQCTGPLASALGTAYGDSSATARVAHIFLELVFSLPGFVLILAGYPQALLSLSTIWLEWFSLEDQLNL
jgi:hypothetical protein